MQSIIISLPNAHIIKLLKLILKNLKPNNSITALVLFFSEKTESKVFSNLTLPIRGKR